ncbi:MAG TPA: outer membrane protein assembly factor BamD [Bacteroidales bacterium]|nr:outer membrane protein assembly factor BamD [Bacteroidales bacterium]
MLKTLSRTPVIASLLILLIAVSCSGYQRLLRSTDHELQFTRAVEYYENENYDRALGLLTNLIPVFRGTLRSEDVNYYYTMVHYRMRDYIMASELFMNFYQAFPRSRHAEEFLFLAAYTKYLIAPRSSLDQKATREAIASFQTFVNRFPASERVEESNRLIDELRKRLEQKVFDQAMLFYYLSQYTAAVTTFNVLIRDFPDTRLREEALFRIVQANFEFAYHSIVARQLERFGAVITAHNRLIRQFPESRFLAQSEQLRDNAQASINRLKPIDQISENQ